jgi:hypothetical protein
MGMQQGALFDSETIDVMRRALDEAIAKLPSELRSNAIKGDGLVHPKGRMPRRAERAPLVRRALLNAIGRYGTPARQARRARRA